MTEARKNKESKEKIITIYDRRHETNGNGTEKSLGGRDEGRRGAAAGGTISYVVPVCCERAR